MRISDCDPRFCFEVAAEPGGENIMACYTCGACSGGCPVSLHVPDYDPRRLIRLVVLGCREEVLSSPLIWLCSSCYACQEVCPQQVCFTDALAAIKNLAARAGYAPPSAKVLTKLLATHGRLLEVGEFENERREELGLPPVREIPEPFQNILDIDIESLQTE